MVLEEYLSVPSMLPFISIIMRTFPSYKESDRLLLIILSFLYEVAVFFVIAIPISGFIFQQSYCAYTNRQIQSLSVRMQRKIFLSFFKSISLADLP